MLSLKRSVGDFMSLLSFYDTFEREEMQEDCSCVCFLLLVTYLRAH